VSIKKVPDVMHQLQRSLEAALAVSDIVLMSGGSSAGNKDMTAEIIDSMGKPGVVTHGIAMKPGKPTIIGVIETATADPRMDRPAGALDDGHMRNKLVVGLPGHPMAAIVAYDVIVNEFMREYCFHNEEEPIKLTARISENIHAGEGRETYQLVSLKKHLDEEWTAEPIHAKSGSISQLMMADGYVKISSLSEGISANSSVEITLIGR
jgi:molybdopterin molybdotransferase